MKKLLFPILLLAVLTGCNQNPPVYEEEEEEKKEETHYAPDIDFSISVKQPLSIVLTDRSTHTYSSPKYTWDFGDGSKSNETNPTHRYSAKGVYSVKLTINNGYYTKAKTQVVTVENPTKCYLTGFRIEKIPYNNKYYKTRLDDDDFVTNTWMYTNWNLLSSANLPATFYATNKIEMTGLSGDNYYTLYLHYSDNKTGSGTQCMKQKITTATEIHGAYPTSITRTSDNKESQVTVFFDWE